MNDLFDILKLIQTTDQKKVLATIIDVDGSSYRKEGAMMLHLEDSTQIGLLSGGCLENDVALRAEEIIKEQQSRAVVYDMKADDDITWGLNNGCNGKISILLEYVDAKLQNHLKQVEQYLKKGIPVFHIKRLSDLNSVLDYIFITPSQNRFGEWHDHNLLDIYRAIVNVKPKQGLFERNLNRYFVQAFFPKPRMIIFGAGPDVRPLVELAVSTGFYTIVTDWRSHFCSPSYFPNANEVHVEFPSTFVNNFTFNPEDSIIIMTHHFHKDQEILQELIQKKLKYLGILGPRKRTQQLLEDQIPKWIRSPVGLPIGAEGPNEIAISILADVIKTHRKKAHKHDLWYLFGGWSKQTNGLP
ncbi:XdhC family protein [Alkalihalobacterium alkalinitrilicum]|uniref:XdhC family protein n=1 Tax=Alkalihalobacterium alkalinitrilicum TaxID=427920 RepID=UPI00099522DE|nr:XdhC family protein [Alkalihalobacterium alkalinitrilicum]